MDFKSIIFEKDGGVATITLNRPEKLNALSPDLGKEVARAVDDVMGDNNSRVLIVTGAGRGFCSGVDLGLVTQLNKGEITLDSLLGADPRDIVHHDNMLGAIIKLQNMDKPVIAAINGPAVGAGMSLAFVADIRIASDKATFGMIFTKRGLVPDGGTSWLAPRILGMSKACEMAFTGDIIDAQEAYRIGMVSRVVPHEEMMKEARALADKIAQGPPIAVQLTKHVLRAGQGTELPVQMLYELYLQGLVAVTEDCKEGVAAFIEKRPPIFKGK